MEKFEKFEKYENVKKLKTTNRKLENFLYLMDILPLYSEKEWDGSTAWFYEDTPELRQLAREFQDVNSRKKRILGMNNV